MPDRSISLIALVECRSEGRGEERPVAVVVAGERFEITAVLDRAMVTGCEAGQPIRHCLWVEVEGGRRFELTRILPDGAWRVRTMGTVS
jgi:hypothetical protein